MPFTILDALWALLVVIAPSAVAAIDSMIPTAEDSRSVLDASAFGTFWIVHKESGVICYQADRRLIIRRTTFKTGARNKLRAGARNHLNREISNAKGGDTL